MSLYPSLEDLGADKILQAQNQFTISNNTYPSLDNYLGLELTPAMIRANMPNVKYLLTNSGNSILPSQRSEVSHHSIREFILCKDKGKVGLGFKAKDNGIFVCIVVKGSPAAVAGVRFGDQVLSLNGILVSGFSAEKIYSILKKSDKNNISMVIRDRPFERTITLIKDSRGNLGFQLRNGEIVAIVKDSSASKNGVLINHHLLEVNGQSVIALKDKEILKIFQETPEHFVKITIVPTFIFEHLTKNLSTSFLKGMMDHSIPEF